MMGAWGIGVYENDGAGDFAAELASQATDGSGLPFVESTFEEIADTEYVEVFEGSAAIAAADVVARLRSGGGDQSSAAARVTTWVEHHPSTPSDALVAQARAAIERVRGAGSETAELWAETDDFDQWNATLDEILQRLA